MKTQIVSLSVPYDENLYSEPRTWDWQSVYPTRHGSVEVLPDPEGVYVAYWEDDGAINAQAYRTLEGAVTDFPHATVIYSTVQP